jgi:tetratricopeptide (TPR) repeat protein/HEAT repeat protein
LASLALSISLLSPTAAEADFNPRGRTQKTKTRPRGAPAARPTPPRPKASAEPDTLKEPSTSQGASSSATQPNNSALIQRYTAIVLNQPEAPFPLTRLAELYRERDGNLRELLAEFEQRAKDNAGDAYNIWVALAGLYKQDGQYDQALSRYQQAIQASPENPAAWLALGHLYQDRGEPPAARTALEKAVPLLRVPADIEQTLRQLMTLSLDLSDFRAARSYHEQLVKRASGSFFAEAELGRELLLREHAAEAESEFRRVVKAATGDNRAVAPALRDLGRALHAQDKHAEALEALERALRLTAAESGLRRELLDLIVEVHRKSERLPQLIALLEKEGRGDFQRLRLLGGLYEETGRIAEAIGSYRAALKQNERDLEVRLKLVQLLQIQGELDEAIRQYEALIRAAPNNPDFVFQLAEALLQRGDRQGAITQLTRLEQRSGGDDQTLAALVEFYERVAEPKRAMALLERLAQGTSTDPLNLVELGDRYFDAGEPEKAKRTWKRLLVLIPSRARALATLGEVYLEHDMPKEALEALAEATLLAPGEVKLKQAYALALERVGSGENRGNRIQHYDTARRLWEDLLGGAGNDHRLAQDARQHIVTLWSLAGTLPMRIAPLERNLQGVPPDLNSGRMLAEMYIRQQRPAQAERVLRRVVGLAPGDTQSWIRLERVLVTQRKIAEAIEVAGTLVKLESSRAREHYQRMAQYAAELYRDDDAIRFAAKAVELSPDDASGHQKLGDMYRRRQDATRAIHEYRKAISKNERLFPAYFDLAELLLSQGQTKEADQLLRRVIRSAVDEELTSRAVRLSLQVHLGQGTLEVLEAELLPLALANPHKPLYRRLLVELYGALAFPLVQTAHSADVSVRGQARLDLQRIGQRAVKPLLDALSDERESQQRVAIELLTHLSSKSAGPALFAFAIGEADPDLRTQAMIAAGASSDAGLLPRFEKLLFENRRAQIDDGDPISLAAAWGLCRLETAEAVQLQLLMLSSDSEIAKALAAVSLARSGNRSAVPTLLGIVQSLEHGAAAKAAAAFALGELKARDAVEPLLTLAKTTDERVRAAAFVALARLRVPSVRAPIADALVTGNPQLREAALGAATVLATGEYQSQGDPKGVPEGRLHLDAWLRDLHPVVGPAEARAQALFLMETELAAAAAAAVTGSGEQARWVARALAPEAEAHELTPQAGIPGTNEPRFWRMTEGFAQLTPALQAGVRAGVARISAAVVPAFVALVRHPTLEPRTIALGFLALRDEPVARQAVLEALDDSDEQVQRLAIGAAQNNPSLAAVRPLTQLLTDKYPWPTRILATQALQNCASLPSYVGSPEARMAQSALTSLCQDDPYALVREAAAQALAGLYGRGAEPMLSQLAARDPEERVRQTARKLLGSW